MARIALVSHDVQALETPAGGGRRNGGAGAFVTHWARLLRSHGDEVTIVLATAHATPVRIEAEWRERYRQWGIGLEEVHNPPPPLPDWQSSWAARLSERVAPLLADFDLVYLADWANAGFHAIRQKRFSTTGQPVFVTVLHGPSEWMIPFHQRYPVLPGDPQTIHVERYAAQHSDYVLAPSQYLLDWLRNQGWKFDSEPRVAGLPFQPDCDPPAPPSAPHAFRNLVFFGRLEQGKGTGLFEKALWTAGRLPGLERVVLLGAECENEPGAAARMRDRLAPLGVEVIHIGDLDSRGAAAYLTRCAGDSLVVVPSLAENFPMAVIETSRIPGLNAIFSRVGGIPEILGDAGERQLFDPTPGALAGALRERFASPLAPGDLARYDSESRNRTWLSFHEEALAARSAGRKRTRVTPGCPVPVSVDICIPYFEKARHFPQTLAALERQTVTGFGVITVDDGSADREAREAFDTMSQRYSPRGWTFFRQSNAFVDAARNRLAARSSAEYLCFLDADDVPAPEFVERLLEAALQSGDDCVQAGGFLVEGDGDPVTGGARVAARNLPLGPSLVCGLFDPSCFGMSAVLIRRSTFQAIGGYRERGAATRAGHEDWELQARLLFEGYRSDVVPECLLYFRQLPLGLSRTGAEYPAKARLLGAYEEYLAGIGLRGLATAAFTAHRRNHDLEEVLRKQALEERGRRERRAAQVLAMQRTAKLGSEGAQ